MIGPEVVSHYSEISILSSLVIPLALAFSSRIRDEAIGRAGNKSEISGVKPPGETLTVMHLNHTKDDTYDTVERALVVTEQEHIIYHRVHVGRANLIGLTEQENLSAIRLLTSIFIKRRKR